MRVFAWTVGIQASVFSTDLYSGKRLFQSLSPIGEEATATELYAEMNKIQRSELGAVAGWLAGYAGEAQQGAPTCCCSRVPQDGEIDWRRCGSGRFSRCSMPGAYATFGWRESSC
jgi:hypothetical protein